MSMSNVFVLAYNWALHRPTDQSTDYDPNRFPSNSAVDGLTDSGKYTHTNSGIDNGGYTWWLVYLEKPILIGKVIVYNRADGNALSRLSYMNIMVFDQNNRLQNRRECGTLPDMRHRANIVVTCSPPLYGQGVEVGRAGNHIISVAEVEVYEFDG